MSSSGQYIYELNGELAPIDEVWSISRLPNGDDEVWSRRRAKGVDIEVTAKVRDGCVNSCTVNKQLQGHTRVTAKFWFTGEGLAWTQRTDGNIHEGLLESSDGEVLLLYPLMRIFTGPVISALGANGCSGRVVVPDISSGDSVQSLLPLATSRRAILEGADSLSDIGVESCQRWRFPGGEYDENATFWLSMAGRLLRYEWRQSSTLNWQVTLK